MNIWNLCASIWNPYDKHGAWEYITYIVVSVCDVIFWFKHSIFIYYKLQRYRLGGCFLYTYTLCLDFLFLIRCLLSIFPHKHMVRWIFVWLRVNRIAYFYVEIIPFYRCTIIIIITCSFFFSFFIDISLNGSIYFENRNLFVNPLPLLWSFNFSILIRFQNIYQRKNFYNNIQF